MPDPAAPEVAVQEHGLDFHSFYEEHKARIFLGIAIIAAALVLFGAWQVTRHQRRQTAMNALAGARSADDLRKVFEQYGDTRAGANAALMLADGLRREKKYIEAGDVLRKVIEKQPDHPLISAAWLSLGATLEAQGKTDEALETYSTLLTKFPGSFSAPFAMLAQAAIHKQKGRPDEARRTLENMMAQFPDSPVAGEGQRVLQTLSRKQATPPTGTGSTTEPSATPSPSQ